MPLVCKAPTLLQNIVQTNNCMCVITAHANRFYAHVICTDYTNFAGLHLLVERELKTVILTIIALGKPLS